MKKYQLLFCILLLPLFSLAQSRSKKESPHSLGVSFGVPVYYKYYQTDYALPLTFFYEYTKSKNTFGVSIQLNYAYQSRVSELKDSSQILQRCSGWRIPYGPVSVIDLIYFDSKTDVFDINLPFYYRHSFSDVKSKLSFFAQIGVALNFNLLYQKTTHHPIVDPFAPNRTCVIIDVKSNETKESLNNIRFIDFDYTIGTGLKYKIFKRQSLFGIVQYQHSIGRFPFKYNNAQKLYLYLGYSFMI
jgi:hypothetical protein